jgi:hypothetical protein
MPAPPEIGNALRKIWIREIAHQPQIEKLRRTNRDVGVTGKIAINLKRESVGCPEQLPAAGMGHIAKGSVHVRRKIVGNHHFLEIAEQHLPGAVRRFVPVEMAIVFELLKQVLREINRARD